MKIKTSELIGLPLDWAVSHIVEWGEFDENGVPIIQLDSSHMRDRFGLWSPSTLWEQGGPIIEREEICLSGPFEIEGVGRRNDWAQRFVMYRVRSALPH